MIDQLGIFYTLQGLFELKFSTFILYFLKITYLPVPSITLLDHSFFKHLYLSNKKIFII